MKTPTQKHITPTHSTTHVSLPVELDQTAKRSETTSQATTQSRPAPRRRTPRVSMEPAPAAAASSSSTSSPAGAGAARRTLPEAAELKLRRKTLESVLEQCQRALELMREDDLGIAVPEEAAEAADQEEEEGQDGGGLAAGDGCDEGAQPPSPSDADYETDELCDLLKLRVESPEFPEKLDNIQKSMYQHGAVDETISWDIISAADIWDDESMNVSDDSEDGYVLVKQEDIVDGIASFMAEYLLPLKQTKDLTPNQLQQGHPCPPRPAAPSSSAFFCPEIFRNFQLQEEYDTYDDEFHFLVQLPYLWTRTKIIEIVAAKDVIFALSYSGLCGAFNRTTNKHICYLNISPDEVIRSLFYNKNNESLITVSVYESDRFSSLKCRTTPIEYIRRGQLDGGFPLFETESLKYPGFVEFDDVNGKVLTFSAQDSTYKVFDLKNYNFLYSICDKNIQEIKISPGIMLVIYQKASNHVPLTILSIEDGTPLKTFTQLLHQNRKVDFIEQFNEKLLVKQDMENLQIIDVRNSDLIEVNKTEFMTPSAFIFLYKNNLFLTFCNRTVAAWNVRGELVTSFDDHELWHPNCNANNIYITADEDLIISYCKVSRGVTDDVDDEDREASPMGSINMSNIFTGKCVAKITPLDPTLTIAPRKRGDSSRSTIRSTVADALEDITALFYDEDRNEIYTGNSKGLVHVWSN